MFERFAAADAAALIAEYPLAWICPAGGGPGDAALLPLVGEFGADGTLRALIGHVPKAAPLHARLTHDPHALILFNGPNGYVSPEHAGRRDWAPTWNFAQLRIAATLTLDDALTPMSLDVLIAAQEHDRAHPWGVAEMGERYDRLLPRITGFRAHVDRLDGRFKLGQDENDEALHAILARHPDAALVRWMRRFNAGRC